MTLLVTSCFLLLTRRRLSTAVTVPSVRKFRVGKYKIACFLRRRRGKLCSLSSCIHCPGRFDKQNRTERNLSRALHTTKHGPRQQQERLLCRRDPHHHRAAQGQLGAIPDYIDQRQARTWILSLRLDLPSDSQGGQQPVLPSKESSTILIPTTKTTKISRSLRMALPHPRRAATRRRSTAPKRASTLSPTLLPAP